MRSRTLAVLLASCTLLAPALAAPPTDEQFNALVTRLTDAARGPTAENAPPFDDVAREALAGISLEDATLEQAIALVRTNLPPRAPSLATPLFARLNALAKDRTASGAAAIEASLGAIAYVTPTQPTDPEYAKALAQQFAKAARHPGMRAHLEQPRAGRMLLQSVGRIADADPAALARHKTIAEASRLITPDISADAAASMGGLVDAMLLSEADVSPALRRAMLKKMENAARAVLARETDSSDPARQRVLGRVRDLLTLTQSRFARGELVGGPAPAITFEWTSPGSFGDTPPASLEQLKGKVVVVDFWATWCGPCIRAFPVLRELRARYADSPVVILGVTSIQGFHMDRSSDKPERIETEGDPARERELMTSFIQQMDITWPVVFSTSNVFNPDYGVRGIPHIAIIDPAGNVRHNALRPGEAREEIEKIDALLAEFKLPVPPAPAGQ